MAKRCMRSCRWATLSCSKRSPTKGGRNSTGKARTASARDVCSTLEAHRCAHGRHPDRAFPRGRAKLSQFCHGCGKCVHKPLSQRWHHCACGVGPVQRDLYSAFLASTLDPDHLIPSCAQSVILWEASEARLRAAYERVQQRANEGQSLHRSFTPGSLDRGVFRGLSLTESKRLF